MHCVYTYRAGFYLRLNVRRMPAGFFVIYRLSGISSLDAWWHASDYAFEGVLSFKALCRLC